MRPPVPSLVPLCVPPSTCSYRMIITPAFGRKHSRHPIRADENGAHHTVRTYLPRSHTRLITSTYRCRYRGSPFLISPDPLLPALPYLLASNVPPPPGRGTSLLTSVRMGRAATQSACFQSPCPLTHCVRSLSARCLPSNGTDGGTG